MPGGVTKQRYVHTIRLRGPWHCEPLVRFVFSEDPRPGMVEMSWDESSRVDRVTMPCDWGASLGEDFRGRVRYRRRFGCPTGITQGDSVQLVLDHVTSLCSVTLNEQLLGEVTESNLPGLFDITALLRSSNWLSIVVEHPAWSHCDSLAGASAVPSPGGLTGEVRLVIA